MRAAQQKEGRSPQARWLQLATVAEDGTARVRTLVFRGWCGPASLELLSDNRSSKINEIQKNPGIEICWLLPKARCQFRLRGTRIVLDAGTNQKAREMHWEKLKPEARALWAWPPPGEKFDTAASFPKEIADNCPIPNCFELIRIELSEVEMLQLGENPHNRMRWRANQNWAEEKLNP